MGFEDSRGTLFFNVAEIVRVKKTKVIFMEDVRGLATHDSGKKFKVIEYTMKKLGYSFHWKIIKAIDFNVPKHRPRTYMVCVKND